MKKIYQKPLMEAYQMETELPIALSTLGTATNNTVLSRRRNTAADYEESNDDSGDWSLPF